MRNQEQNSLLHLDELMGGAITERFNTAIHQVLENILDPNTEPCKTRKITLVATVTANDERDTAAFSIEMKTALIPRKRVSTVLLIGEDADGVIVAKEVTKQLAGQINIDGQETMPKIIQLTGLKTSGGNGND